MVLLKKNTFYLQLCLMWNNSLEESSELMLFWNSAKGGLELVWSFLELLKFWLKCILNIHYFINEKVKLEFWLV